MYYLNPAPSPIEDSIGINGITQSSRYYEALSGSPLGWAHPVVKAQFQDSNPELPTNAAELVPNDIVVIPDKLTCYTSYARRDLSSNLRYAKSSAIGASTITRPAEYSAFIYAFNKDNKLIDPFTRNSSPPDQVLGTYQIQIFGNHYNREKSRFPFIADGDADTFYPGYNPDKPTRNPPHAIMVRARTAGQFSIQIHPRLNRQLTNDASLLRKIAKANLNVTAIDGVETIDQLSIYSSNPFSLSWSGEKLVLRLRQGESIDLSLTGRVKLYEWDDKNLEYAFKRYVTVSLTEAFWTYRNICPPISVDDPGEANDRLYIAQVKERGLQVTLVGGQPSPKFTLGLITITAHGRQFEIDYQLDV